MILSKRALLSCHFFLYSIGLLGIIYGLSQKLQAALLLIVNANGADGFWLSGA